MHICIYNLCSRISPADVWSPFTETKGVRVGG